MSRVQFPSKRRDGESTRDKNKTNGGK